MILKTLVLYFNAAPKGKIVTGETAIIRLPPVSLQTNMILKSLALNRLE